MNDERFRRLADELALIQVWEALWNDDSENARKARQIRRDEILRELSRIALNELVGSRLAQVWRVG
jgi:hypothetical protein